MKASHRTPDRASLLVSPLGGWAPRTYVSVVNHHGDRWQVPKSNRVGLDPFQMAFKENGV